MAFREYLSSILIYAISFIVLILLILFVQPENLIFNLLQLGVWGMLTLILLYIADLAIRVYRWKILLLAQGVDLPLKTLVMPVVSALAINLFTIARAGEAVRMYALKRNGTRYSDTLSSIVIEQVLSIFGLLFVITGSLFFVGSLLQENSGIIQQLVVILFIISIVGLMGLILMILLPNTVTKILRIFPSFLGERLISLYTAFLSGLKDLRSKPVLLSLGILTSASIWLIEGIMLYVIAFFVFTPSLSPEAFFGLRNLPWVIAASCAGNVTFIVPILPGSIGTYEVVVALILMYSPNYPGTDATLIALIDRVAKSVILGFLGGYAIIRLGGREILRLRKDFSSIPNESNELENVQNVDINAKPSTIAEENSFIKN